MLYMFAGLPSNYRKSVLCDTSKLESQRLGNIVCPRKLIPVYCVPFCINLYYLLVLSFDVWCFQLQDDADDIMQLMFHLDIMRVTGVPIVAAEKRDDVINK